MREVQQTREQTNARIEVLEGAVRQNSVDIRHLVGEIGGSFFHPFKSKEELALAAAEHFAAMADSLLAAAPYRKATDPLDRLGYVDFRAAIMRGDLPEFTCLLGMMVQETYETHPAIREALRQGQARTRNRRGVPHALATVPGNRVHPNQTQAEEHPCLASRKSLRTFGSTIMLRRR